MRIDADDMPALEPLCDPIAFQELHKSPKLEEWVLDEKQLALSVELSTQIRRKIVEKAKEADTDLPEKQTVITN